MTSVNLVQLDCVWENKPASHDRVRHRLEARPPAPGSLVMLPETFSTGFSTNLAATAQGEPPEDELFLAGLARQYQAYVMGGVVHRISPDQGQNQSVTFAPDGQLVARYVKMQPFSGAGEDKIHVAGHEVVTFPWQGFTVAPFVCYDLRFPEHFRRAVDQGANLLAVIASWPVKRDRHWQILLQARAIENQAYVVGVNRCGSDPGYYHSGRSIVVDPHGVIVADAGEQERVVTAAVELDTVLNWRRDFPALRDRR